MRSLNLPLNGLIIAALLFSGFGFRSGTPAAPQAPSASIHRVKPDGLKTAPCGGSWPAACDLQYALSIATSGDEIWVMRGLYKPTTTLSRDVTFNLVSGVAIYGGFAGTETSRGERDWQNNLTVLSGDIDNNDNIDAHGVISEVVNILGNNSYHVVSANSVNASTLVDGFTITGGKNGSTSPSDKGAGLYNLNGDPALTNVTFSGNKSYVKGGGIYNLNGDPLLTNVTFIGNDASSPSLWSGAGGGIYSENGRPSFVDVTFSDNYGKTFGGGMYSYDDITLTMENITFNENSAYGTGGGLSVYRGYLTLTRGTFISNTTSTSAGALSTNFSTSTLTNVTFSGNSADLSGAGS